MERFLIASSWSGHRLSSFHRVTSPFKALSGRPKGTSWCASDPPTGSPGRRHPSSIVGCRQIQVCRNRRDRPQQEIAPRNEGTFARDERPIALQAKGLAQGSLQRRVPPEGVQVSVWVAASGNGSFTVSTLGRLVGLSGVAVRPGVVALPTLPPVANAREHSSCAVSRIVQSTRD